MTSNTELEVLGKKTIIIGDNPVEFIAKDLLSTLGSTCRIFVIITDSIIARLYLNDFIDAFAKESVHIKGTHDESPSAKTLLSYIVPPRETSKCRKMKDRIEDFLLGEGCNKDTCLIALGGGVVGDLVGYVASTFLRGVPLVQIPTTLLAMVDSSIGGKNGIDTPSGKNLIGTIYQPRRIYVDIQFLQSLPKREFFNGMAEIIKTVAISSEKDFSDLEAVAESLTAFVNKQDALTLEERRREWLAAPEIQLKLQQIVASSIQFKVNVVNQDCGDTGLRHLLNFGHTIGHAIELYWTPKVLHGECVAIGILLELKVAEVLGHCNSSTTSRVKMLLQKLNLPTSVEDPIVQGHLAQSGQPIELTLQDILKAMRLDKKNSAGRIQMVLLSQIGKPVEPRAIPVDEEIIAKAVQFKNKSTKSESDKSYPHFNKPNASILLLGIGNETAQELANELKYECKLFSNSSVSLNEFGTCYSYGEAPLDKQKFLDAAAVWIQKDGIVISGGEFRSIPDLEALYTKHSNFSFILPNDNNVLSDLVYIVNYSRGVLEAPLPSLDLHRSFFLCLALSDISVVASDLESMAHGVHAVEIRVDLMKASDLVPPSKFKFETREQLDEFKAFVVQQVGIVREKTRALPIIYTVRTVSEGGLLPDDTDPDIILQLYLLGLRLGCQIIDVQMNMPKESVVHPFLEAVKGRCKVIASYHHLSEPLKWGSPVCLDFLKKCLAFGDVVKIISIANEASDNRKLEKFLENYYDGIQAPTIPLIAFNMGKLGQGTRLMNRYLTPVTHPKMCQVAGLNLSQLSLQEVIQGLTITGRLEGKSFYIFGHPISNSLSPLLHNTIFQYFGFPHNYSLFDSLDLEAVKEIIRAPNFGGGSVTIPHKLSIIPFLDSISDSAASIGAVNTIIRKNDGRLHGDNTDWLGVFNCLKRAIAEHPTIDEAALKNRSALVLGAGGTARAVIYALRQFNISTIYIFNRSPARLQELIDHFDNVNLISLNDMANIEAGLEMVPFVAVDTCPEAAGNSAPEFVKKALPIGGVFVKLAYSGKGSKPGPEYGSNISVVTGLDILIQQGFCQSESWTGIKPNSDFFTKKVYEKVYG